MNKPRRRQAWRVTRTWRQECLARSPRRSRCKAIIRARSSCWPGVLTWPKSLGEVRRCAMNVEAVAALLALRGRAVDGARLLGAIDAWRDRSGTRRERPDQALQ